MGARAPSEAAAAVARAFETASCRFASEVASRSPRTAHGSCVGPGGTGDSGDDDVKAPRRLEGDAHAEPPDASGPATTSFASPGGHHVGFIQYHPPVAATAEGVYAPALERARRAFGGPSSTNDAEPFAEDLGARAALPRRGSADETADETDRREEHDSAIPSGAPAMSSSGGIFVDTAHAFGSRRGADPTRPFRWRSLASPTRRTLARLPLDAQTRFVGTGDVSLWDLEVGVRLGGGLGDTPSVVAEASEARTSRCESESRFLSRRFLSRRFAGLVAKWNPSSLEKTENRAPEKTRTKDTRSPSVHSRMYGGDDGLRDASDSAETPKSTLETRSENEHVSTESRVTTESDGVSTPSRDSSLVLASPSPPSAFLCAHVDGWGARGLEFELAGGKFVKRKNDATGAESATRTRRSWTAAVDLTGAAEPTVEWVDVTERDETEGLAETRASSSTTGESGESGERGERENASWSTKTRVRLAYRSPLKLAGLHPVIRALEMGRRRRFVDDRASVEIRRARSPAPYGRQSPCSAKPRRTTTYAFDVLDARLAVEARPSLLRISTRWRKARTFETGTGSKTTYAVTHEGVDTLDTLAPSLGRHAFRQKASFEAEAVRVFGGESSASTRRARVSASSALRSARETPSLVFFYAREGTRWTVSGETRVPASNAASNAEVAFVARRAFFLSENAKTSENDAPTIDSIAVTPRPPVTPGHAPVTPPVTQRLARGFVEFRLSLVGGDARAFATFATGAASAASRADAGTRAGNRL